MVQTTTRGDRHELSLLAEAHASRALFRLSEALDAAVAARADLTVADALIFVIDDLRRAQRFSAQTQQRYETLWTRFERYAAAHDVTRLVDVDRALVRRFVFAPTIKGRKPGPGTKKLRRSAIRTFWRALREVDLVEGDPTLDLDVEADGQPETRPLTDAEVESCRWASLWGLIPTRLPALWALAEAGAATGEASRVAFEHVDVSGRTIWLPGTRKIEARQVDLSDWGLTQIKRRAADLESSVAPLAYLGGGSEQSAQASMCRGLEMIFRAARIDDPAVRPSSVRAWVGCKVFASTGRIEAAAAALGLRSLDATATVIGLSRERWGR